MIIDTLDDNNLDIIMMDSSISTGPSSDILIALQNEIQNMNLSIKINVQLLSKKNMIQFKEFLKELAYHIHDRLNDAAREVTEEEIYLLIEKTLFPILWKENDRLFHMEYDLLNSTNDILKERLEEILYCNAYQDCLLMMNELIEQFRMGIHNTSHVVDLEQKVDSLTYELAMNYKLHSSIELYMDIKKLIEEYKMCFHEVYSSSLKQLQTDNFDNAVRVKDNISCKMQEHKYEKYDLMESKRTIS